MMVPDDTTDRLAVTALLETMVRAATMGRETTVREMMGPETTGRGMMDQETTGQEMMARDEVTPADSREAVAMTEVAVAMTVADVGAEVAVVVTTVADVVLKAVHHVAAGILVAVVIRAECRVAVEQFSHPVKWWKEPLTGSLSSILVAMDSCEIQSGTTQRKIPIRLFPVHWSKSTSFVRAC